MFDDVRIHGRVRLRRSFVVVVATMALVLPGCQAVARVSYVVGRLFDPAQSCCLHAVPDCPTSRVGCVHAGVNSCRHAANVPW